jgi:hypothetical protein
MTADDPPGELRRTSREDSLDGDPLAAFVVWWDDIGQQDVAAYEAVLNGADNEKPLQAHLTDHPRLLIQYFGGGHGRWVIPQKRLGAEFVPDFVLGEADSDGRSWTLVELQTPKLETNRNREGRLFMKDGRQSEQLDEGIRQVLEWRRWLSANRDYARRPRVEHGLGLEGIDATAAATLIIGREADLTDEHRAMRKQLAYDHRMSIRSYDWVTREARRRLAELADQARAQEKES